MKTCYVLIYYPERYESMATSHGVFLSYEAASGAKIRLVKTLIQQGEDPKFAPEAVDILPTFLYQS